MAHDKSTFINYTPITNGQFAFTIDGLAHEIQGVGEINIVLPNGSERIIPQVYYVPKMQCNLFFIKLLAQVGGQFCISRNSAILYNTNHDIIAKCFLDQDLYTLGHSKVFHQLDLDKTNEMALTTTTSDNLTSIWHKRLAHVSLKCLQDLINHHMVQRLNLKQIRDLPSI